MREPTISVTTASETSGHDPAENYGYCELQVDRSKQEDAMVQYYPETLEHVQIPPEEIGHRLWTSLKLIEKNGIKPDPNIPNQTTSPAGTTASVTVYDGHEHIITATLGDSVAFAAVYGSDNKIVGVVRLNSIIHQPYNGPDYGGTRETDRIKRLGGAIELGGVRSKWTAWSALGVSRSMWDDAFTGVISDPTIDITTLSSIAAAVGIPKTEINKIDIICTCDGFTDASQKVIGQLKQKHEQYLLACLREYESQAGDERDAQQSSRRLSAVTDLSAALPIMSIDTAEDRAIFLAHKAVEDQRESGKADIYPRRIDNVSVGIYTLKNSAIKKNQPVLTAVFDGHDGQSGAAFAAQNISQVFEEQLKLTPEEYASQDLSIHNSPGFTEDNPNHGKKESMATTINDPEFKAYEKERSEKIMQTQPSSSSGHAQTSAGSSKSLEESLYDDFKNAITLAETEYSQKISDPSTAPRGFFGKIHATLQSIVNSDLATSKKLNKDITQSKNLEEIILLLDTIFNTDSASCKPGSFANFLFNNLSQTLKNYGLAGVAPDQHGIYKNPKSTWEHLKMQIQLAPEELENKEIKRPTP